jgi:hypothetical protein
MRLAPGQHIRLQFLAGLIGHGVTAPAGGAGGGTPAARPTGSASSSFRQAAQACGFGGHRAQAG